MVFFSRHLKKKKYCLHGSQSIFLRMNFLMFFYRFVFLLNSCLHKIIPWFPRFPIFRFFLAVLYDSPWLGCGGFNENKMVAILLCVWSFLAVSV